MFKGKLKYQFNIHKPSQRLPGSGGAVGAGEAGAAWQELSTAVDCEEDVASSTRPATASTINTVLYGNAYDGPEFISTKIVLTLF